MREFKCHKCSETIKIEDIHKINAIMKRSGWGVIYDISNGLDCFYFCPECFNRAKRLANELKDAIGIEHFSLSTLVK